MSIHSGIIVWLFSGTVYIVISNFGSGSIHGTNCIWYGYMNYMYM